MQPISFRSDVTVELVRASASDADVVFAARVSTAGEQSLADVEADAAGSKGLINYLMRERHGSPFEHNSMTFFVQAPIFVWREHMRHRIASYNEESGRYRELKPVFYVPSRDRNVVQVGKTGAYEFLPGEPAQYDLIDDSMRAACTQAYASYQEMLAAGIAREVARMVLPVSIYSSAYVTLNEGVSATGEELADWLNAKIGKHERVDQVVIRDSLPKTMIGKLDRKTLRAEVL